MTEDYSDSQVKRIRFSKQDIINLVNENILARNNTSYDFDYQNPFIKWTDSGLEFIYVQLKITDPKNSIRLNWKPLKKD